MKIIIDTCRCPCAAVLGTMPFDYERFKLAPAEGQLVLLPNPVGHGRCDRDENVLAPSHINAVLDWDTQHRVLWNALGSRMAMVDRCASFCEGRVLNSFFTLAFEAATGEKFHLQVNHGDSLLTTVTDGRSRPLRPAWAGDAVEEVVD